MPKPHITCLFSVLIILSGCSVEDNKVDQKESCYANTDPQFIMHDGENREYILFIPASYDGTTPAPLVLNFHGFGGSASAYMEEADVRPQAESNSFILVYPQGSCLDGSPHWNPCPPGGDNKSEVDDFGFIEAVINEVSAAYNVDPERVYALGYSNGGMMAYGLAHFKSELIAAVASISGTMLDCIGPPSHPMPVVHLHGTNDGVLPYNGGDAFTSTQDILDYWIEFNHTITDPTLSTATHEGTTIEHYVYDQGDNSVSVEHYKYIDGGHVWFDATFQGQTTAELVWNFVSRYDLNGLR